MLTDIRKVKYHIKVHCNTGNIVIDKMGHLPGYRFVWYYPDAIASILSIFLVARKYHVQYNSRDGGKFVVWKDEGTRRCFQPGPKGLYYSNFKEYNETAFINNGGPEAVNTVEGNLTHFKKQQVKAAADAQRLQETAGLTTIALLQMIDSRSLINFPITREAGRNSVRIWGPSEDNLKGKTTRAKSNPVATGEDVITLLPSQVLEAHGSITLGVDIIEVNGTSFLVTYGRVL